MSTNLVYLALSAAIITFVAYPLFDSAGLASDVTAPQEENKPDQTQPQHEDKSVEVGTKAPDFTLPSQTGEMVSLHDFVGQKPVVLYFYPKDETPVCTKEACSFRDNMQAFKDLDATVIGVSADSVESHKEFADKYKLPFILISDKDNELRKLYAVPKTLHLMPGRVTYVIGKDGLIKTIFSSQLDAEKHVAEALASLKQPETAK